MNHISSSIPDSHVPTPWPALDDLICGLRPCDLIIVTGPPSVGKTAFVLNVAAGASVGATNHHRAPTLFYTLEMDGQQATSRVLCIEARVDSQLVKRGLDGALGSEREALKEAADRLSDSELYIHDVSSLTVAELRGKATQWAERYLGHLPDGWPGLVMVDYIQLVRGEHCDVVRGLKALARDLEVPVVAVSQVSDHDPCEYADVVIMLEESGGESSDERVVTVLKNSNGPTGSIRLSFSRASGRWSSLDGGLS